MGRGFGGLPGALFSLAAISLLRKSLCLEPEVVAKYRAVRPTGFGTTSPFPLSKPSNIAKLEGFAIANGTQFFVGGKPLYLAGTNAYYLAIRKAVTDDDVTIFFRTNAKNGVNIVRLFAFVNGYGSGQYTKTPDPIQPRVGIFDEASLQRLDLILKSAADYGQRVIMTMVNYEDELGGMQWYVDEILGYGNPKELFYTNPRVKDAFKGYIRTILERVNTMTGLKYKDDPAIFSVELANEPHTSDDYETKLGAQPGKVVRDWIFEMSNFVRSVDKNHMISTGEEGYRIDGAEDPEYPQHAWMNNGTKGVDYSGNILAGNISFATVHIYPDSWDVKPLEMDYVNSFIADRAKLAHAVGKPFVVEEYGMQVGYMDSRQALLTNIQAAANAADAAATLVWQVYAWPIDPMDTYNFDWSQPGNQAIRKQISTMKERTAGTYVAVPLALGCQDVVPPSAKNISCSEQATVYKQCNKPWMEGYCRASCGTCPAATPVPAPDCTDVAPPSYGNFTCHDQAIEFKHCGEMWMADYCHKSCGRCGALSGTGTPAPKPDPNPGPQAGCSDIPPPNENNYSCFQQAVLFRQCHQPWMKGYCMASCNACPLPPSVPSSPGPTADPTPAPSSPTPAPEAPCTDEPPTSHYSCHQQAVLWGKCGEAWMEGKCQQSCGRCGEKPCVDVPPPSDGNYSCHQQAVQWKHCSEPWMQGYCQASCGVCTAKGNETAAAPVAAAHSGAPAPLPPATGAGGSAPQGSAAPAHGRRRGKVPPQVASGPRPGAPTPAPGPGDFRKFNLPCSDIAPPSRKKYSCLQQAVLWQKCGETWMSNYCHASCGRCSSMRETILSVIPAKAEVDTDAPVHRHTVPSRGCVDIAPPITVGIGCEQSAKLWGQCHEPWMDGYCLKSCGRCTGNSAITSSVALEDMNARSP